MSGVSPFLVSVKTTFIAKAIMRKTDTSHSTISAVFFRESYVSVETIQKKKKLGTYFCSPVQWFLITTITWGSSGEPLKDVWQNTTAISLLAKDFFVSNFSTPCI